MFDYLQYEFRDCDKEFSLLSLEMLCADGAIPWDALTYLVGEVKSTFVFAYRYTRVVSVNHGLLL